MAHFAKLDENNVVLEVLVVANEDILDQDSNESEQAGINFLQSLTGHSNWKKTSYNTKFGKYFLPDGTEAPEEMQDKAFRGNFGSPGAVYDPELDVFFPIKEEHQLNWIKDTVKICWKPPIECPDPTRYWWNVEQSQWVLNPGLE
jgi:hypothetical protein